MSLSKQEKLGIVNFILTIVAIILIKYLSMYIPWLPTAADGTVEIVPLAITTIIAVLAIHAITWIILVRYFNINKEKNSKTVLIIYEILFLLSIVVLYISVAYDFLPAFLSENMLSGIGLFIIIQMALSIFFTYAVSKIPTK
ncbi:hypothetical protein [Methanimicrococcus blatticola]|uniref:Uncharacterized protein n=1 Tax=Methanimicrococcus blatticola TaxID=91560 RepID=A0A484F5P7_9EURY|nr:hypothetical protein [Methanimicrococcus blatticola]MBZ3935918.1 hypothetical protein [Methanimicrococcus blatticola]MCC2509469.1 hypothetical protein [Methanimicrococcus blatticola]TDQ68346.1 hypothetical protein C7391_1290 [Methanimicrococcus blatticola]